MRVILFIGLVILALTSAARSRSKAVEDYDMPFFASLPATLASDERFIKGVVYEISDDWRKPIAGFGNGNDVVLKYSKRRVLIRPYQKQYAEGDLVEGNYFKFIGTERYSESKIAQEVPLPVLAECTPSEVARYEEDKQRRLEELERMKYEIERKKAVELALSGIDAIVEDERVWKDAVEKTSAAYDAAYAKSKSIEQAAKATIEFGRELLKKFAEEIERKQREWDAAHPEEAAARKKAEAERLAKLAKAKLDAEIKKTEEILDQFAKDLKTYADRNPKHPVPQKFGELAQTVGARILPPYDSWNRRLIYTCDEFTAQLVSAGVDGKYGTDDDMSVKLTFDLQKSERQKGFSEYYAEMSTYEGRFIPSVCGFKFGTKMEKKYGCIASTVVTPLKKPFRGIANAELTYEGRYSPRLVSVRLIGNPMEDNGNGECQKIISILERNYKIKIPKSVVGNFVRAEYEHDGFAISVRNDNCVTPDGDNVYVVEFRDNYLSQVIQEVDKALSARRNEGGAQIATPQQEDIKRERPSLQDDEGLDSLNL